MDMTIDNEWKLLYSHNPKIQAFAIMKNGEIIWVTRNWNNLVDATESLATASSSGASSISVGGVTYRLVAADDESYIATADKDQGHLLMALVEDDTWAIAWATPDSVPELTIVDLAKTAIQLMRRL
ncbi:MAG: hypothetical protein EAX81_06215 [Candidatus Thorarchaeota archaeon]|nr:hypothetical protein [Candidatus Thorarchaeota archaeon]